MRIYNLCATGLILSAKQREPLSCDAKPVQFALLNGSKFPASGPVYFSRTLSGFNVAQKKEDSLACTAQLILRSNLDNRNHLELQAYYTVQRVNNSSLSSTSNLQLDSAGQAKMQNWVAGINAYASQIGDYQLTRFGALYVLKQNDMEQVLYFNGKLVEPKIDNYQINIEKSYNLSDSYVFLIGSYSGGTIDMDTPNNRLIRIESGTRYQVSGLFAPVTNGIIQNGDTLHINAFEPGRPYVESADFPVYVFESGILKTLHQSKSDAYYQAKISTFTPLDIVNIAKADQCFDTTANQLDVSHACGYAAKYCFMFKAIKESSLDENYIMLSQICN